MLTLQRLLQPNGWTPKTTGTHTYFIESVKKTKNVEQIVTSNGTVFINVARKVEMMGAVRIIFVMTHNRLCTSTKTHIV